MLLFFPCATTTIFLQDNKDQRRIVDSFFPSRTSSLLISTFTTHLGCDCLWLWLHSSSVVSLYNEVRATRTHSFISIPTPPFFSLHPPSFPAPPDNYFVSPLFSSLFLFYPWNMLLSIWMDPSSKRKETNLFLFLLSSDLNM